MKSRSEYFRRILTARCRCVVVWSTRSRACRCKSSLSRRDWRRRSQVQSLSLTLTGTLPHSLLPYVRRLFVLCTRWMDWINVLFNAFIRQLFISESAKLRWLNCVSYWKMFIPNLNTKFINWGKVYFS